MKLALVLSGGGAKGAFEAGVARALYETGHEPDIFSGTSAGALNAAALACGMSCEQLEAMWRGMTTDDVYRFRHDLGDLVHLRDALAPDRSSLPDRLLHLIGWTWLLDTAPLRRTLVDKLGGERIAVQTGRVLTVSAIDMLRGHLARFTNTEPLREDDRFKVVDLTVDHLMASAAIPLLFPPIAIDGVEYWDGGLLSNTPLAAAMAYRPDVAVVVTTNPGAHMARPPDNLNDAIDLVVDALLRASLLRDLRQAERLNKVMTAGTGNTDGPLADKKPVKIITVEVPWDEDGPASMLEFESGHADRMISLGYGAARQIFEHRFDDIPAPA